MSSRATLGPDAALDKLGHAGVVAVVRSPTHDDALRVSRLLVRAGIGAVEITLTTQGALNTIEALHDELPPGVLLGAGTLRSAADAYAAADAGADFLVSSGATPGLVSAMRETGRLALPGVCTPTEVLALLEQDIRTMKLFPASLHGPSGLGVLRGPFPEVAFMPTGGVRLADVHAWRAAGALAVGLGSALAPPTILDDAHASDVEARARMLVDAVRRNA